MATMGGRPACRSYGWLVICTELAVVRESILQMMGVVASVSERVRLERSKGASVSEVKARHLGGLSLACGRLAEVMAHH